MVSHFLLWARVFNMMEILALRLPFTSNFQNRKCFFLNMRMYIVLVLVSRLFHIFSCFWEIYLGFNHLLQDGRDRCSESGKAFKIKLMLACVLAYFNFYAFLRQQFYSNLSQHTIGYHEFFYSPCLISHYGPSPCQHKICRMVVEY